MVPEGQRPRGSQPTEGRRAQILNPGGEARGAYLPGEASPRPCGILPPERGGPTLGRESRFQNFPGVVAALQSLGRKVGLPSPGGSRPSRGAAGWPWAGQGAGPPGWGARPSRGGSWVALGWPGCWASGLGCQVLRWTSEHPASFSSCQGFQLTFPPLLTAQCLEELCSLLTPSCLLGLEQTSRPGGLGDERFLAFGVRLACRTRAVHRATGPGVRQACS